MSDDLNRTVKTQDIKQAGLVFVIITALAVAVTTISQAVMCPEMTQTELFLRIPYSLKLDFEECYTPH